MDWQIFPDFIACLYIEKIVLGILVHGRAELRKFIKASQIMRTRVSRNEVYTEIVFRTKNLMFYDTKVKGTMLYNLSAIQG